MMKQKNKHHYKKARGIQVMSACLLSVLFLTGCQGIKVEQAPTVSQDDEAFKNLVSRAVKQAESALNSALVEETRDSTVPSTSSSSERTDEPDVVEELDGFLKPTVLGERKVQLSFYMDDLKLDVTQIKLARYMSKKEELVLSFNVENLANETVNPLKNLILKAKQGDNELELGNYVSNTNTALNRIKNLEPKASVKNLEYSFVKVSDQDLKVQVTLKKDGEPAIEKQLIIGLPKKTDHIVDDNVTQTTSTTSVDRPTVTITDSKVQD